MKNGARVQVEGHKLSEGTYRIRGANIKEKGKKVIRLILAVA